MSTFRRILKYFLEYKLLIAIAMLFSMFYSVMYAISVYLIGPFLEKLFKTESPLSTMQPSVNTEHAVDVNGWLGNISEWFDNINATIQQQINGWLGDGSPREVLARLCLLIIAGILLKNIFSYLQGYIMAYVEQGIVRNLRNDLYTTYHRLPLRYFQKRKTGELISRVVSDCNTVNNNLNSSLVNLMKEPITMFTFLFVMVIISWQMTLFIFLVAPPSLYVLGIIGKKLRKRTTRTQDRIAMVTAVLDETISSIRVVKAFAMEEFEINRFRKANYSYFRSLLKQLWLSRMAPPITEVIGVSMAVAVLFIGGLMVLEKNWLQPEDFFTYLLAMFAMMQSAKRLSEIHVKLEVGIAASRRIFEIMDTKNEVAELPDSQSVDTVTKGISFKNVSYAYDPGTPVLHNISLDVAVGETIAIVGPSGGGKSTMMDLLPRFFDPTEGSVELDGVDLREYRLSDLRRLMGIVTQETILFHDTIRANIAYGRPDIPFEDIVSAAKTANAHRFIESFKKGYDTVIGDRGTKLSGGQKQRIVIARAILKNPPVLIFDEATSALDSEAEAEVQTAIDHLMEGRTAFVIAHRLSTVQNASRIIVLDKGRIVETGTHQDLFENGQLYRRLHNIQFSSGDI